MQIEGRYHIPEDNTITGMQCHTSIQHIEEQLYIFGMGKITYIVIYIVYFTYSMYKTLYVNYILCQHKINLLCFFLSFIVFTLYRVFKKEGVKVNSYYTIKKIDSWGFIVATRMGHLINCKLPKNKTIKPKKRPLDICRKMV